jgi:hypothetical protein
MSLSYADASTLASNANFKAKVKAAIADVATSQIRALVPTAPNYVQLTNLSVRLMEDVSLLDAVCYLVASNAPAGVTSLNATVENTLPDTGAGSIKGLVRSAMDALVTI